jgi:hypothetical protein
MDERYFGSRPPSPPPRAGARLIDCPACGRQISPQAEACPQCGHPNRPAAPRTPAGPSCYACSADATTRCQSCGVLSCATHLQSIYVYHGKGGAYELRCENCYSSAVTWKVVGWIIGGIGLIVMAIIFFTVFLPGWNESKRKRDEFQREFDQRWDQVQPKHEDAWKNKGF